MTAWLRVLLAVALSVVVTGVQAELDLPSLLDQVRGSVVGIASHDPLGAPRTQLSGTGFVVGDGLTVVTNAHVVRAIANGEKNLRLVVLVGRGPQPSVRTAEVVHEDAYHDMAVLRITGPAVPALKLAAPGGVREGQSVAFTGFPIGAVLGLYPVTHVGIVSCIVPIATPQSSTQGLSAAQIKRLGRPFDVYQLDAIAYPGNSGSPVFDLTRGEVIAVVNSVLVKASKESVLKDPSAITYAIPIQHLRDLLGPP